MFHIYTMDPITESPIEVEKSYQWDIAQFLIVDSQDFPAVSFSNGLTPHTYDVELMPLSETGLPEFDGKSMCQIPDEMFQNSWEIKVYAWDSRKTYFEEKFEILSRPKPADYWYTPTEVEKLENKVDKGGHYPGQILIADDYGNLRDGELPNPDLSSYLTKDEADLNYLKSYEMDTTFKDYLKLYRIYEDSDGKRLSNKAITTDSLGYIKFTDKVDSTNFLPKRGLAPNALLLTDYQGNVIQNTWKPFFDDRMRWDYKQEYWGSKYTQAISEFNHDYGTTYAKSLMLYVYLPQDSNAKPQLTLTDSKNDIVFNRDLDCSASDYYLILKFKCFQGIQEIEWAEGFGSNEELYSNYNLIPLSSKTQTTGIKQIRIFKNGGTGITLPKLSKIKLMSNVGGIV